MDNTVSITKDSLSANVEHAESLIIAPDKPLYITPATEGIDYQSIFGQILSYVNMEDILAKIEAGAKYVVQIPVEYKEAFQAGDLFIMKNQKTGKMWPTLMKVAEDGKNQVVSPLPIVEEYYVQGNPAQELTIQYHNMLMHQQLSQIIYMLGETYRAVLRIEHGQMDDRIGLLEAGKNGLMQALSMSEGSERTMQINSSRQNLLTAQAQIGRTLKRRAEEFEPIPKNGVMRFYKETVHPGYLTAKDQEVNDMQDYYGLYLNATDLIAVSYAISGELKVAEDVFVQSEQFIQSIDFSNVKSIEYSHPKLSGMFYSSPVKYISEEKKIYLEEAKPYDCIAFEVSGDTLLEVLGHGKE